MDLIQALERVLDHAMRDLKRSTGTPEEKAEDDEALTEIFTLLAVMSHARSERNRTRN